MKRIMVVIVTLLIVLLSLGTTVSAEEDLKVVASTSWVGAIAEAAGARNVTVLAPIELRHPPEYDFRPVDIQRAVQADLILWGGYEGFIRNLVTAAKIPDDKVIRVVTNNAPPVLAESAASLAAILGTTEQFREWEKELQALAEEIQTAAAAQNVSEKKVIVQAHQQRFAEWVGYNVVGVFGPAELTPVRLAEILKMEPEAIIDNWHSAQGEPIKGTGRTYHSLINFPGPAQTVSILDVIRYNAKQLGLLD